MKSKPEIIKEIDKNWVQQHFDFDQRDFFIELLNGRNVEYCLETGFCTGSSSTTTLAICNPKKMISIGMAYNNMDVAKALEANYNFELLVENSLRTLNDDFFEKEFPHGIDFYFVDGGHEAPVPLHDLGSSIKYLNDDFIIIVDDYHSQSCPLPDVDSAVDVFIQDTKFSMEPILTNSGKGMAIITE